MSASCGLILIARPTKSMSRNSPHPEPTYGALRVIDHAESEFDQGGDAVHKGTERQSDKILIRGAQAPPKLNSVTHNPISTETRLEDRKCENERRG